MVGRLILRLESYKSFKYYPEIWVIKGGKNMAEDTELVNIGGLFRNTSKKGDVYYSGKSEDGDQYVLFRNAYWKEGAEPAKPYFRLMKRVPKGSAPSAMND